MVLTPIVHLCSTLLSTFLFTAAVLAHPLGHDYSARVKRVTDASHLAGSALLRNPHTFKSVSSSIIIPYLSSDSGSGVTYWNGIVDDIVDVSEGCNGSSLQAGIYCVVNDDKTTSCKPWFRWNQDELYIYNDFTIVPGDTVELQVTVTSATTGTIYIANSDGNYREKSLEWYWERSLCGSSAQWVLSALLDDKGFMPLANFGDVTFQSATAVGVNGENYAPGDHPTTGNIVQDGRTVTYTWVGDSNVTVIDVWTP